MSTTPQRQRPPVPQRRGTRGSSIRGRRGTRGSGNSPLRGRPLPPVPSRKSQETNSNLPNLPTPEEQKQIKEDLPSNEIENNDMEIIQKEDKEVVSLEKYNELLQKYEELNAKYHQQIMYVSALEAMVDVERSKVAQLTPKQKKGKGRSNPSFIETSHQDPVAEKKEEHKRATEQKEMLRKQQSQARLHSLDDRTKIHRMHVLDEMLNTEKDYLETLQLLMRIQHVLLSSNCISLEEKTMLFSNIDKLFPIHEETVKSMESRFFSVSNSECWNICVGEFFITLGGKLSSYSAYITNQEAQSTCLQSIIQRKSLLNTLYKEIPEFYDTKLVETQLRSYLIAPIQRICKYPLLLKELIQSYESHEDVSTLRLAIEKIENATRNANEHKKVTEHFMRMQQIGDSLENAKGFDLHSKFRQLIKEGDLLKISKGRTQERHFFLFDDILLYGSKSVLKPGKIHVRGMISLDKLLVNDLPDTDSVKNCFELVRIDHKKKKYIICSKLSGQQGDTEKEFWMKAIQTQVDDILTNYVPTNDVKSPHTPKTPAGLRKFSSLVRMK